MGSIWMLFASLAFPLQLAAQNNQDHKHKHHHYQLIDLGTLGGPQSVVAGAFTHLLNNRGTVAGCADTSAADPNFPDLNFSGFNPSTFSPAPDPHMFHPFRWQDGVVADLGALPGLNNSCPIWMSENGLIAGGSENGAIDPVTGLPEAHATLWKGDEIIDLGTLGGSESIALAMNDRSQVVGAAANTIPDPFSLFNFSTQTRAFLWRDGVMGDLGTLGGPDAFAASINEGGQIAGCSYTDSTDPTTGAPILAPFLWRHGIMTNLGTLGGTSGCASLINNRGQVIGGSFLKGDQVMHSFFWDRGVLQDLSKNFGGNVETEWLDDSGEVAGNTFGADLVRHGFLWKDGVMSHLGKLPGDFGSAALGVNQGRVVGVSGGSNGVRGFLWEDGGPMVDLNTLIPPDTALQPAVPLVINDRGEIAGSGFLSNGDSHAFLLIPCDENHRDGEDCEESGDEIAVTQTNPAPRDVPNRTLPQPLMRRMSRYRFPSPAVGPRN